MTYSNIQIVFLQYPCQTWHSQGYTAGDVVELCLTGEKTDNCVLMQLQCCSKSQKMSNGPVFGEVAHMYDACPTFTISNNQNKIKLIILSFLCIVKGNNNEKVSSLKQQSTNIPIHMHKCRGMNEIKYFTSLLYYQHVKFLVLDRFIPPYFDTHL